MASKIRACQWWNGNSDPGPLFPEVMSLLLSQLPNSPPPPEGFPAPLCLAHCGGSATRVLPLLAMVLEAQAPGREARQPLTFKSLPVLSPSWVAFSLPPGLPAEPLSAPSHCNLTSLALSLCPYTLPSGLLRHPARPHSPPPRSSVHLGSLHPGLGSHLLCVSVRGGLLAQDECSAHVVSTSGSLARQSAHRGPDLWLPQGLRGCTGLFTTVPSGLGPCAKPLQEAVNMHTVSQNM